MVRTGRRREWPPVRVVRPTPGAREKGAGKDPPRPYREPTLVPWVSSPRRVGNTPGQGTRQIGPVPSVEGVPGLLGGSLGA